MLPCCSTVSSTILDGLEHARLSRWKRRNLWNPTVLVCTHHSARQVQAQAHRGGKKGCSAPGSGARGVESPNNGEGHGRWIDQTPQASAEVASSRYMNMKFIVPTSDICLRLFPWPSTPWATDWWICLPLHLRNTCSFILTMPSATFRMFVLSSSRVVWPQKSNKPQFICHYDVCTICCTGNTMADATLVHIYKGTHRAKHNL